MSQGDEHRTHMARESSLQEDAEAERFIVERIRANDRNPFDRFSRGEFHIQLSRPGRIESGIIPLVDRLFLSGKESG